ncbi:MAG: LLM class flavin-dependent oxidoreductase [Chloroflexi bacterium]|nr:LLM class flavin-dependent oxidoreductase [Chloroflexota bacterium]
MATSVKFGLTLPNRMVILGVGSMQDIISMGVDAEETGLFQSLWVGDSILAKRRPESVALLGALAARTQRVRLGVGCMASFPIRNPFILAAQWATLDMIAGPDRMILAACLGGAGGGGDWEMEQDAFGVPTGQRVRRMIENIEALKVLWTQEKASYEGQYVNFSNVISEPRPVTKPHPALWIAANPRPVGGDTSVIQKATRRVARLADGWMTTMVTPQTFGERLQTILDARAELGKDIASFDNTLYYNANINEDKEAAFNESKKFLDDYYSRDWPKELVELWVAHGSPQEVVERIKSFAEAGAKEITIRITSYDQRGQLERLVKEVLPAFQTVGAR